MRIEKELALALELQKPCIWIKTIEEADFINQFLKFAKRKTVCNKVYSWSLAKGMLDLDLESHQDKTINKSTAIEPLFQHIEHEREEAARKDGTGRKVNMYILKDLHLIADKPNVIRGIRDTYELYRGKPSCYCPLIVISPVVKIPAELEHLFTVIDYTTPSQGEIQVLVKASSKRLVDKGLKPLTPDTETALISAFKGFTLKEIKETIAESVKKHETILLQEVMEKRVSLIKKTGILEYRRPTTSFDDIAGNDTFKNWVEELRLCFSPEARKFGIARPKGYLALGVPGTAKSVMAEAMAAKLGLPLIKFNISKIMSRYVGDSERNIDKALNLVKACAPCVLYIDEVEKALAGYNGSQAGGDSGALARVMGAILEFMSDSKDGVFTVMTSNDVSKLPPELTRAGRLDAIWYFSLPTLEEREAIFRVHLNKVNKVVADPDITTIAELTRNYTGAEIEQIVKASLKKAFYDKINNNGSGEITLEILKEAKELVIPVSKSSQEKIAYLENWAEGKALYANREQRENEVHTDDLDDLDVEIEF